jgi:hypothetical protein
VIVPGCVAGLQKTALHEQSIFEQSSHRCFARNTGKVFWPICLMANFRHVERAKVIILDGKELFLKECANCGAEFCGSKGQVVAYLSVIRLTGHHEGIVLLSCSRRASVHTGKLKKHELRLSPAKTEYDSGAISEVVLPVVGTVGKFRQKILGLNGSDCKMTRHRHINSDSGRRRESSLRS